MATGPSSQRRIQKEVVLLRSRERSNLYTPFEALVAQGIERRPPELPGTERCATAVVIGAFGVSSIGVVRCISMHLLRKWPLRWSSMMQVIRR